MKWFGASSYDERTPSIEVPSVPNPGAVNQFFLALLAHEIGKAAPDDEAAYAIETDSPVVDTIRVPRRPSPPESGTFASYIATLRRPEKADFYKHVARRDPEMVRLWPEINPARLQLWQRVHRRWQEFAAHQEKLGGENAAFMERNVGRISPRPTGLAAGVQQKDDHIRRYGSLAPAMRSRNTAAGLLRLMNGYLSEPGADLEQRRRHVADFLASGNANTTYFRAAFAQAFSGRELSQRLRDLQTLVDQSGKTREQTAPDVENDSGAKVSDPSGGSLDAHHDAPPVVAAPEVAPACNSDASERRAEDAVERRRVRPDDPTDPAVRQRAAVRSVRHDGPPTGLPPFQADPDTRTSDEPSRRRQTGPRDLPMP